MELNDLEWEFCVCDSCGCAESELVFEGPDRLTHLPGTFQIVRCVQCGIYRQNPRLAWTSLKNFYTDDYVSHTPLIQDYPSRITRLDKRYGNWKRLRAVERFIDHGRLLEVGCGTGTFLEEALRSKRWEVSGVEPVDKVATYVSDRLGIEVHNGRFSDTLLSPEYYDVIVMWNVLEHLDHPFRDINYAYRLLKDGGWFVFSIPNMESYDLQIFGKYWLGWELPRHLYLFPRSPLENILTEYGFEVVSMECLSTSYATLGLTLDFWVQSWPEKNARLGNTFLRLYNTIILRAALVPPLWILDKLNRSTLITWFVQKKG